MSNKTLADEALTEQERQPARLAIFCDFLADNWGMSFGPQQRAYLRAAAARLRDTEEGTYLRSEEISERGTKGLIIDIDTTPNVVIVNGEHFSPSRDTGPDNEFICPHGKDVRHIDCAECAKPSIRAPLRAREPVPGAHVRADGVWCEYLHDGQHCNKCGFTKALSPDTEREPAAWETFRRSAALTAWESIRVSKGPNGYPAWPDIDRHKGWEYTRVPLTRPSEVPAPIEDPDYE